MRFVSGQTLSLSESSGRIEHMFDMSIAAAELQSELARLRAGGRDRALSELLDLVGACQSLMNQAAAVQTLAMAHVAAIEDVALARAERFRIRRPVFRLASGRDSEQPPGGRVLSAELSTCRDDFIVDHAFGESCRRRGRSRITRATDEPPF